MLRRLSRNFKCLEEEEQESHIEKERLVSDGLNKEDLQTKSMGWGPGDEAAYTYLNPKPFPRKMGI